MNDSIDVVQQIELSKSYTYTDTGNAPKFWKRFEPFFECLSSQTLQELIPMLHHDADHVEIPNLPLKTDYDIDNNGDDHDEDEDLYFAEMPVEYEYFNDDKKYIDEQCNIQDLEKNKTLRTDAIHQHYPNKSVLGHSMSQRVLQAMVYNTNDEMWSFEYDKSKIYTNDWTKVGKNKNSKKKHKKKKKKNKNKIKNKHKNKNKHSDQDDENDDDDDEEEEVIKPRIRYMRNQSSNRNISPISFEEAVRGYVCNIFFNNDKSKMKEVETMKWYQREDDECCATIRSLEDRLNTHVNKTAPNNMKKHINITNQLLSIAEEETKHYESRQRLDQHFDYIINRQINTETLSDQRMIDYLDNMEHTLDLNKAIESLQPTHHVDI